MLCYVMLSKNDHLLSIITARPQFVYHTQLVAYSGENLTNVLCQWTFVSWSMV